MDISTKNINVTINDKKIIEDISIIAKSHKFLGIIGPNGSGKSTLLKCIYRVRKPNSGDIFLKDTNLKTLSLKESSKMLSVVSQDDDYNFDFTVSEVVLMGRAPYKKALERDNALDFEILYDSLKRVSMLDFKDRNFCTLSGGEKKRVLLARALAQKTSILILDEPTNHLDIKHQLKILDTVKSLDLTVISAMHDLNIASSYCDYLYALKDGKLAFKGTPKEVLTSENIKFLYDVDSKILDIDGNIHIIFKSK